ncbi:hypothetical protein JTB14_011690 [Gonioctena quinquepunctata]|nr:hypothetical protein JTB14_011690 [Gonioctena quinquepunctata]
MRKPDKSTMPIVLVTCRRDQKDIFDVFEILSIRVKAEPQKPRAAVGQCHRCQRFGHSQNNCFANPSCVKCGGKHSSTECKKPTTTPPKCANCQGGHTASYRGCTCVPKLNRRNSQFENGPSQNQKDSHRPRPLGANSMRPGVSYAQTSNFNNDQDPKINDTLSELMKLANLLKENPIIQLLNINVSTIRNA